MRVRAVWNSNKNDTPTEDYNKLGPGKAKLPFKKTRGYYSISKVLKVIYQI